MGAVDRNAATVVGNPLYPGNAGNAFVNALNNFDGSMVFILDMLCLGRILALASDMDIGSV